MKTTHLAALVCISTLTLTTAIAAQDEGKKLSVIEKAPEVHVQLRRYPDFFGSPWQTKGGILERSALFGDPGGVRTELVDHGIYMDASVTQVFQGNAYGGRTMNSGFNYGGSADYFITLDSGKLDLWPGGLIMLHGETVFGEAASKRVGAVMPINMDALMPAPNDKGLTTLSQAILAQGLSDEWVVVLGKIIGSALADNNEFANNERTQFLNSGLVNNPLLLPFAPYTSLGAFLIYHTETLTVGTAVLDGHGEVETSGFDTAFSDPHGFTLGQEWKFSFEPDGLPGNYRFGALFSNKDFSDFAQDRRTGLGDLLGGLKHPKKDDNYAGYINFDQYLSYKDGCGWGLFGRFGWAPPNRNGFDQFYSLGVGAKGVFFDRKGDQCGLGWYYVHISRDLRALVPFNLNSGESGIEAYYNFEVTPAFHLTGDVQFIFNPSAGNPSNFNDDNIGIAVGVRAQLSF